MASKTHCPAGHAYAGENLYVDQTGRRHCKACRRVQLRASRARRAPAEKKTGGVAPMAWQERFWRYVTPGPPEECWEWQGARNAHGYGRLNRGGHSGATVKAHRASWEIHHGEDPGDADICHRCDNPPCVNPAHLFKGDARSNAQDMASKGRAAAQNGQNLLTRLVTDDQVLELREKAAAGMSYDDLAREYGIVSRYVAQLANGTMRRDAPGPLSRKPNGMLKLSDNEIKRLRERAAAGERVKDLAIEYAIAAPYVSTILHGRLRAAAGGPMRSAVPAS